MSSTSGCPFSLGFCNFNEKNSYDKVSLEFKAQEQASPSTCDIKALVRCFRGSTGLSSLHSSVLRASPRTEPVRPGGSWRVGAKRLTQKSRDKQCFKSKAPKNFSHLNTIFIWANPSEHARNNHLWKRNYSWQWYSEDYIAKQRGEKNS